MRAQVALVLLVATASTARADEPPCPVLLWSVGPEGQAFGRSLARALADQPRLEVVDGAALARSMAPASGDARERLAALRADIAAAERALEDGQPARAEALLDALLTERLVELATPAAAQPLRQVVAARSRARRLLGATDGAAFDALLVGQLTEPGAGGPTVRFSSTPNRASVTVDGTLRGRTPLAISLAPGPHVVRFGRHDRAPVAHLFTVTPEGGEQHADLRSTSVSAPAARVAERLASGEFDAGPEDLALVSRAAGVPLILVITPAPGASRAFDVALYSKGEGFVLRHRQRSPRVSPRLLDGLAGASRAISTRASLPAPVPRCGEGRQPPCGGYFPWVAAGVVVLGALVAGFALGGGDGAADLATLSGR